MGHKTSTELVQEVQVLLREGSWCIATKYIKKQERKLDFAVVGA